MKKLRDFLCDNCGSVEEFMVADHVEQVVCQKCNNVDYSLSTRHPPTKESMTFHLANKVASGARYFGNTTGRSPSAASR